MIAIADVELQVLAADARERAGRRLVALVCDDPAVEQHVVVRLPEEPGREFVGAVGIHPVAIRHRRRGAVDDARAQARVLDAAAAHVAREVALDLLAEQRVAIAGLVERVEHGRGRDRALQDRDVREDQQPLDRALDLGGLLERQVRAHAAGVRAQRDEPQAGQTDATRNHALSLSLAATFPRTVRPPGKSSRNANDIS